VVYAHSLGWMSDKERSEQPGKIWFNWPLVLGLVINFAILAAIAYWLLHRAA
jgi:hypothetical protein